MKTAIQSFNQWAIVILLFLMPMTARSSGDYKVTLRVGGPDVLAGSSVNVFADVNYPRGDWRVTFLARPANSREWTVLTQNAERAGQVPYVPWTPGSPGDYVLRVDVAMPGYPELRDTRQVKVHQDHVNLRIGAGVPAVGSSSQLIAEAPGGANGRRITFDVKYDDEARWRTIAAAAGEMIHYWTPERTGPAEVRVTLSDNRGKTISGSARVLVRENPQASRMEGFHDSPITATFPPPRSLLSIDAEAANAGDERIIHVAFGRHTREDRRVTLMFRHEKDQRWTILRENSEALMVPWTPWKAGRYTLRVDIGASHQHDEWRDEVSFFARDPQARQGPVRMYGQ
jgi:hypothetical protein